MRYWVHALRYIKAYWAKLELRETVLNEEQERKILERILCGGFDDGEVCVSFYVRYLSHWRECDMGMRAL